MTNPIRAALERLLSDIQDLSDSSQGIVGLHRNGDPAPWNELLEGGRYSSWLGDAITAARAALAEPVAEGPKDEEVEAWADDQGFIRGHGDHPCGFWIDDGDVGALVRTALARYGHQPAPPTEGEVAKPQKASTAELTVNIQIDTSPECLQRLFDGLNAAVKPDGGYRAQTTDDPMVQTGCEQMVGVEWWLPQHGCDSLENTIDAIKGRILTAVFKWWPTATVSLPQGEVK